jgi:hypothetical protein
MVSVLTLGPKIHLLNPGGGDEFLRAIKIRSTPSFGWEVKPEAPCYKILRNAKITCKYKQKYFSRPNSHSFLQFLLLRSDDFARDNWLMNQEFSSVDTILPSWFSMLMYHLVDEQ